MGSKFLVLSVNWGPPLRPGKLTGRFEGMWNEKCEMRNELARNAEKEVLSENPELRTQNSAKPLTQNSEPPRTEAWRLACGLY